MNALFNGKEIRDKDRLSWVKIFIQEIKSECKESKMAEISLWIWFWYQACQREGK